MNRVNGIAIVLLLVRSVHGQAPDGATDVIQAPHVLWSDAGKHIDSQAYVYGKIVATGTSPLWCFLNFHEDFRNHFKVVIARHNLGNFTDPPERYYKGKIVRVYGRITAYQSKPEIKIASPRDILVLDKLPTVDELAAMQSPPPPPAQPVVDNGKLVIASYNVENLFDGHDDPYTEDEHTPPKPKDEMTMLAAVIRKLNADVLALQEVENRGILQRFVADYLPDQKYAEVVMMEGNDERGIDVALLSRIPVEQVISHRHRIFADDKGNSRRFERDALQVRLAPTVGPGFDVIVLHLKSKQGGETDESLAIRTSEAGEVRRIVNRLLADDPRSPFIVCGDLNDTVDSQALALILGEGSGRLVNFAEELATDQRVSYRNEPHRSMIDYVLCSPGMAERYRSKSYRIEQIADGASGSDHNPVVAEFNWDDLSATSKPTGPD